MEVIKNIRNRKNQRKMNKYPTKLKDRQELMYQYEVKYGDNWFMNLLARYLGLRRMYNLGIIKGSKD